MGYTPPYLDVRKISGGWAIYPSGATTDDLTIYSNLTDTYANIKLFGNGGIYMVFPVASGLALFETTTQFATLKYDTGNNQIKIQNNVADKDTFLETSGTGVLKFGTYTAGAATDSTGYITIKDAGGTTRKLMVQA